MAEFYEVDLSDYHKPGEEPSPAVRVELNGCPCGTCKSQRFIYVSDGMKLMGIKLTREEAAQFLAVLNDGRMFDWRDDYCFAFEDY
jgi:hypothetical protein